MKRFGTFIFLLLLLPNFSFAEPVGGANGILQQLSHDQINELVHKKLIGEIKIVNTQPPGPYTANEQHYHNEAWGCTKSAYHKHAGARDHKHDFSHCDRRVYKERMRYSVQPKAMMAPKAAPRPQASSTNVQEQGVDEADFVKTDGRYLYAVENNGQSPGIRIYDTQQQGGQLKQISAVGFSKDTRRITGIYLLPEQKKLIALASSYSRRFNRSRYYPIASTEIITVDISVPTKPRVKQQTYLGGQVKTTRRIGNRLYVVINSSKLSLPSVYRSFQTPKPATKAELDDVRKEVLGAIKKWSIADSIPQYRTQGQSAAKPLITSGNFYLNPKKVNSWNLTTALSINLASESFDFESLGWFGDRWSTTVYASQKALYVTSGYQYGNSGPKLNSYRFPADLGNRLIHKFSFKGTGFDYRGSGAVLGEFKWGPLSSFQLDEDAKGNLRVVTSNNGTSRKTNDPAAHSPVVLTALAEHPTKKQLITLSRIPNRASPKALGKPGEQLYGARLFDDYAYFVTFKRTDPLYVVDMRNPKQLKVTGELVIPGFSDYLHPLGDGLLLGVGMEAEEDGNWARLGGVKMSLFDIHNPNNPTEIHKLAVGKRGTSTPANRNHHAFTSLAMNGTSTTRVAIPISLVEDDNYQRKDGLHRFEVDRKAKRIKHLGAMKPLNGSRNWWSWNNSDRSIIIGNKLYYYHDGHFWQGAW